MTDDPMLFIEKGYMLEKRGDYEAALQTYKEALYLDDRSPVLWKRKGDVLVKLNRFVEAHEAYMDGLLRVPDTASLYINEKMRSDAISLEAYESILQLAPDNASVHYQKGHILFLLKRYNDALVAQEKAISYDRYFAPAYISKGLILQKLGRPQEALKAYMKSRELGYKG